MHASTFQQSPNYKDAAILKIDAEIQSLTEQIRRLKSERNALTSTYAFPAEILSKIFMVVQVDSKSRSKYSKDAHLVLGEWLVVTHVSKHWRTVALGCSTLWCEIDGTVPAPFVQEFLARSRGHSLSVNLDDTILYEYQHTDEAGLLSSIFAETFRIQTLQFETEGNLIKIQPYISSAPAPKLTKLHLSGSVYSSDPLDLLAGAALFRGTTPRLTDLSLSSVCIDLTSPVFMNNLTALDIFRGSAGPTVDWLRVLRPMAHLSTLKLRLAFTDEAQGVLGMHIPIPKDFGVIFLPQLSRFVLHGCWLESDLDFLAHITFPFKTELEFSSSLSIVAPNLDDVAQSPLAAFLRVHRNSRCDSSKIEIDKVELGHSTRIVETMGEDEELIFKTSITLVVYSRSIALLDLHLGGLEKAHRGEAHLAEILSLTISHATSFTTNLGDSEEIVRRFSCWFPHLREISVSGDVDSFLAALHSRNEGTVASPSSSVEDDVDVDVVDALVPNPDIASSDHPKLFRSLELLEIKGESVPSFEGGLIKALRSRRAEGLPIKRIRLSHCTELTSTISTSLKGLVDDADVQYHRCELPQRRRRTSRYD